MAPPRKRHVGGEKKPKNENHNGVPLYGKKDKKASSASSGLSATGKVMLFLCIMMAFMFVIYTSTTKFNRENSVPRTQTQNKLKDTVKEEPVSSTNKKSKIKPQNRMSQESKANKEKKTVDPKNTYDRSIAKELNKGMALLDKQKVEDALRYFRQLVEEHPKSPLALYGKAVALDKLADQRRSNDLLQECIQNYRKIPELPDCPAELKKIALVRMAGRLSFLGRMRQAAAALEKVASLFPSDVKVLKDLGVQYLMYGNNQDAEKVFKKVLKLNPGSGFAKSHLGFALKVQLHYQEAIPFLIEGVTSGDPGADDGRFYFHLGDALTRTGKPEEANKWYADAARKGIFLSAMQRSLYNADTSLTAKPWWTPEETGYAEELRKLEKNWHVIREEGLAIMDQKSGGFIPEEENLRDTGDWKQFTLYQQGRKQVANCRKTPRTCAIMDTIPDAIGCKRGQVKFSVMLPGTHVWPHTGPTNCRLRSHLGLVIPDNVFIRVGTATKTWQEGKVIIIDDSIDHEVWHNGTSFRLIFIVDFWHPELTPRQRATLTPI
ncbi:aspartyl/asparaginyl beta-hydroxylase isoform X3 [Nematostella vectensis]|uniref:aspartyl/asparaginyl beta-hydroxylase isoform X2 n=1 Tax=Nematostella vectensis TaxID=45351 RepID=UPI0013905D68|nr:aspartyl/asparaginyl beta-hydroxylase isoform X2 [Nematostella vectensis]XP_032229283.1 aspartyl/asparaginyl beta-hydroxylase isoform X3 [Nematostella vectensis]